MTKKAILIGAGQIGRGFTGQVLDKSGYKLVFIDVSAHITDMINEKREYKVIMIGAEESVCTVRNVSAFSAADPIAALELRDADLVTTSVGPANLKAAAEFLAAGIAARHSAGETKPLDVIACENMESGTTVLYGHLKPLLTADQLKFCEANIGFPDAEVSRMAMPSDDPDPLTVKVEEYMEWIVDRHGLKGDLSDIEGLELTDDPAAYIRRKIFTLTGHAMLGYLGYQKGYTYIYQAAYDRDIFRQVFTALTECGRGWSREYGISELDFYEYVTVMLRRFSDTRLKDLCTRICREPARKLAASERFIGPAQTALKYGIMPTGIVAGIRAALKYDFPLDPQATEIQSLIRRDGIGAALEKYCGLTQQDELYQMIIRPEGN